MILVLNCGSQSVKIKLFDRKLNVLAENSLEILDLSKYAIILKKELKEIIKAPELVKTVGHRVVHGGGVFLKPTKIDKIKIKAIEKFSKLAPLHNPYNILGIKISQKIFPKAEHVAVFDTEFFSDLPAVSSTYPLPENILNKHQIKRFGFHGISHEYAAKEAAKEVKQDFGRIKIITCHLGGGTSLSAIENGAPADTSMGFTPLEGPVMMARTGSIDPGIIFYLSKKIKNLENILNYESGIKALCHTSSMLEVLSHAEQGNKKANFALNVYTNSIKKYIGAYFAVLGGCDLLVFTGAIGYGSSKITSMILEDMPFLKNTKVSFIKPDEELAIAKKIIKIP